VDTQEFLGRILPSVGLRCAVGIGANKRPKQIFGPSDDWLANTCEQIDLAKANAYHACASFRDGSSRKAENVMAVGSFWCDLDVGDDPKKYPSIKIAATHLLQFCHDTGLADPLIVKSGNGLHVYWPMDEDMTPDEWLPAAHLLKQVAKAYGLKADPSRTADIASILRPPGTHHRKAEPKLVRVVQKGVIGTLAAFRAALERQAGTARPASRLSKAASINDDLIAGQEFPPSSGHKIASECAVMALMRDTRGDVDQPTWYHSIGVLAFTTEGEALCHEWSDGHPSYSPSETSKKVGQALKYAPTTCVKLAEDQPDLCQTCPHYGRIVSPISLGYEPLVPVPTAWQANQPITTIEHVMDEGPAMAAMNGRFAIVHDYGGQSTVVTFDGDGKPRVIDPDDMKTSLANRFVRKVDADGVVKMVPLVGFWMRHQLRREYDRAIYDPENTRARSGERTLNMYRGFARDSCRGLWSKMRRHLWVVVCRRDRRVFRYLLMWLAHAVQRPGTAPGTVIVLKSAAEGSGKTMVWGWMHSIFGTHSMMLNDPEQLLGRFNGQLEAVSFLIMNEPTFPGDHKNSRKLKSMITEPEWLIERKYRQPHAVPNIAHIVLTTNEDWVVPAGSFVRRYLVLEVDPRYAGDHAYFAALAHEADDGGIEAMLGFLLALDIRHFKINDVPTTEALIEQQLLSAPLTTTWALDMAENTTTPLGIKFGADNTTESLHASFSEYAKARGARLMSAVAFGRWLSGLGFPATLIGAGRQRGWAIPDVSTFQQVIRQAAGIRVLP
jgi:hypothetical protein